MKNLSALTVLSLAAYALNAAPAHAGANVNINVGIPVGVVVAPAPAVVAPQTVHIQEPPDMAVIPGSNVYFAPGINVELFFYDNHWWNRRGDRWYRANGYNGPWAAMGPRHVPAPVHRIPADYRTVYVHEKHIPYGQWKKTHGKHDGGHKWGKHGGKHGNHDD